MHMIDHLRIAFERISEAYSLAEATGIKTAAERQQFLSLLDTTEDEITMARVKVTVARAYSRTADGAAVPVQGGA